MRGRNGVQRRIGAIAAALALMTSASAVVLTTIASSPAGASTTTVTNTADDGTATSLRAVLDSAADGDVINLVAGATYQLTLCMAQVDVGSQVVSSVGELRVDQPVTINGNGATIEQTCPSWRVIHAYASLTVNDLTITGGTSNRGGGGGIRVDASTLSADVGAADTAYQLVIRNSSIVNNCTTSNGGGFKMDTNGDVTIVNSTFSGNRAFNVGGGFSHSHTGDVLMVNSTVTGNSSLDHGGVDVRIGDFTAVYSDIVGNTAGVSSDGCGVGSGSIQEQDDTVAPAAPALAANVYVNSSYGDFIPFGTVVAQPTGGVNCLANTSSSGYNFADDLSCDLGVATDQQGTGSAFAPKLGSLAANGGPTQTLLPQTGSPLIDAIPTAACSGGNTLATFAVTTDQRLLVRPDVVNQKCDIGSVEIQTEVPPVIQPTFTG